jgi:hypothetical protein
VSLKAFGLSNDSAQSKESKDSVRLALPCLASPRLALPCLASPRLALPCRALRCVSSIMRAAVRADAYLACFLHLAADLSSGADKH